MRKLILIALFLPSFALAEAPKGFRNSYEGFRYTQDRFDKFVIACLQTFDNKERNYNDEWHRELEDKAIKCADRLIEKSDEYLYGKEAKK